VDHPALKNQYRGWDGATADHDYNWFDPYDQSPLVPARPWAARHARDGTMVGYDYELETNNIGMAPGAKWISCKGAMMSPATC